MHEPINNYSRPFKMIELYTEFSGNQLIEDLAKSHSVNLPKVVGATHLIWDNTL